MEGMLIIMGAFAAYSAFLAISGFGIGVVWATRKTRSGELRVSP